MGLREIVFLGVSLFIGIYLEWFVLPATRTAYTQEVSVVNTTSTMMQQLLPITNNFWTMFPALIAILLGWQVWQYLSEKGAFDY